MKKISNICNWTLLVAAFLFTSCTCSVSSSGGSTNYVLNNLKEVSASSQKIRNQIHLEASGGLRVETAFLMQEKGDLVPADNTIQVGDRIKLILKIKGWEAIDGIVPVGVGQQLVNSDHRVMYRNDDLFADSKGFSPEDAQYITMIMEVLNTETIYNYYQVDFKVWNKKAAQQIYGNYRFKIKAK